VRELVRQWWGKAPGFTLATVGLGSPWTALVHGGLVRRVVTTFMGEGYPFPTPQALISRAVLEGRLEVSNWSMLTFPLRLLAGAMGVPFLPTRSLLGSTMEEDNARSGDLIAADDPFGVEGRMAYVRALVPDVALLHGWVADRAGNVITASPLNENMYGAMAARGGAVVTVEKIVSTDFIRRHADLVRLPSQISVADVIQAIDGPVTVTACSSDDENCDQFSKCNVRDPLWRVRERILSALGECTIAELAADPPPPAPARAAVLHTHL